MLTSLRGVYKNGTVLLIEPAPATTTPVEVVVVFLEANSPRTPVEVTSNAQGLAQSSPTSEHMVRLRAAWQQARELAVGMTGPTLSEEVLAERQEDS